MPDYIYVFDASLVIGYTRVNGEWKFREGVPIPANDHYTTITLDELKVHQALGLAPTLMGQNFVEFVEQIFVLNKWSV